MDERTTGDDIARIEQRIEDLQGAIERCRKLSLTAKIAIGAGGVCIVLTLTGLVAFVPWLAIAALAAVIGGIVLLGSNSTTWKQTETALKASEALRTELIGQMDLRVVEERPTLH
jgi:hypothetical protein